MGTTLKVILFDSDLKDPVLSPAADESFGPDPFAIPPL